MGRPKKSKGGNGPAGAPQTEKTPQPILDAPMSGERIAAQLRAAAKALEPTVSNLSQQKSELLLKEVEKAQEKLRSLANLIYEACALGKQGNLFASKEKEEPRPAKTLFSKEAPDKKSAAAGERP